LEKIAGKSEIDLSSLLIDWELTKMLEELKENITQMGLDFDIYLKNIKKTTEELKKEWRPRAQERVRAALILQEIAKNEMVDVSTQEVENEINKILLNYPDVDSAKRQIDIERLKEYARGRLKNEKVLELLESL
jgi:trigger factor